MRSSTLYEFTIQATTGAIGLPGWSTALLWRGTTDLVASAGLTLTLMLPVALLASAGRSYLPPLGVGAPHAVPGSGRGCDRMGRMVSVVSASAV